MCPVEQAEPAVKPNFASLSRGQTEIRIKGKSILVPSLQIDGRAVITSGKWLKTAVVHDEELLEDETLTDAESFVLPLKSGELNADIFTFSQRLPHTTAKFRYHVEWDNFAVIPITTYSHWFKNRIEPSVQRAIRKAAKTGIEIRVAQLDDEFIQGIVKINNDTPIRQGRTFWHFHKSFDEVKREHLTYAERNIFLGAYLQGDLIGYIRMIQVDRVASVIQLLTMTKHYDKRPANALLAKAVELCEQKGLSHLMYCNYIYKDPKSSLTEFKKRSGFEQLLLPRYYIPLTLKGKIALKLGLHRGLASQIPEPLVRLLLRIRGFWYGRKLKSVKEMA
jgi:Acetyltransferase (GNAT) family